MRVLHIITGLSTGGAERALYNLLHGGIAENFNNHIISLSDEGTMGSQIRTLEVPVTALDMCVGLPSLSRLAKLRRTVREFRPDLIQGWMYHGNLAATLACTLAPGCPILSWNVRHSLYDLGHEKPMTQKVIRLNRFFSTSPDALLYNSHLSRKQHEAFGFSSAKGRVIPNGIDVKKFSFSSASRQKIRSELGVPDNALVVGHVARLHPMKDHPLFLKAAVDIAQRNLTVHFLLSGCDVSMGNESLKQLIPVELRNRFHLLGEREDVPELMCAMDVLCLSSTWGEGFPNVIGEAMATGLPCVATDVGDSRFIIDDTGIVVPIRDEKRLILGLKELLKLPRHARQALGKNARTRIEDNFTLSAIVDRYGSLYRRLIAEKR